MDLVHYQMVQLHEIDFTDHDPLVECFARTPVVDCHFAVAFDVIVAAQLVILVIGLVVLASGPARSLGDFDPLGLAQQLVDLVFGNAVKHRGGNLVTQYLGGITQVRLQNLPEIHDFSGFVIAGSHHNVTEQPGWMPTLINWLYEIKESGNPVLGICFGHQILAHAFGGKVDFSKAGRELGSAEIQKSPAANHDPLIKNLPEVFVANESHGQSVLRLPAGAVHLASNQHSKNQAFRLGKNIWGVQFHPEFSVEHMQVYMNAYQEISQNIEIKSTVKATPESASIIKNFVTLCQDMDDV